MKKFELVIEWDYSLKGDFPSDVLKECDTNLEIQIARVNSRTQQVTLSTVLEEGDTPEGLAYQIGYLVSQITTRRLHSLG